MICCAKLNLDRIFVNLSQTVLKMNANNAESRKRNYTPRENQKTLEGNEMLRQLHEEDGMGWCYSRPHCQLYLGVTRMPSGSITSKLFQNASVLQMTLLLQIRDRKGLGS